MARIERLIDIDSLRRKLEAHLKKKEVENVVVGFTQAYGIFVHENLEAYHEVGQAKFLETPAIELQGELADIISNVAQRTGNLQQGLVLAGLRLQREAQLLTPVDTGALRASAFTCLESQLEAVAQAAAQEADNLQERG